MALGAPEITALVARLAPIVSQRPIVQNVWLDPLYVPVARRQLLNVAFDRRQPAMRAVKRRGNDLLLVLDFCVLRLTLQSRSRAMRLTTPDDADGPTLYGPLILKVALGARTISFHEAFAHADDAPRSAVQLLDPDLVDAVYRQHGPDVLAGDVCAIRQPTACVPIGPWLRDCRHLSGAGGLLVDDALWLARVRPDAPADALAPSQFAFVLSGLQWSAWRHTIACSRSEVGSVYWTESNTCPRCGCALRTSLGFVVCPDCQGDDERREHYE